MPAYRIIAPVARLLAAAACVWPAGCRLLPPNYLGLVTAERAGPHPQLLHFTHGLALEDPRNNRGTIALAGKDALLLIDHRGNTNRVQLVFCKDGNRALYERVGQRDRPLAASESLRPAGVRVERRGSQLRGSIDVFVALSERADLDVSAFYEHYPRVMCLVGYLAVPADHADRSGLAVALDPTVAGRDLVDWAADLVGADNPSLPRLPAVDVKYLVPTTLVHRLAGRF